MANDENVVTPSQIEELLRDRKCTWWLVLQIQAGRAHKEPPPAVWLQTKLTEDGLPSRCRFDLHSMGACAGYSIEIALEDPATNYDANREQINALARNVIKKYKLQEHLGNIGLWVQISIGKRSTQTAAMV